MKFVSDLRQVSGFLQVLLFPPLIKFRPPRYNWNIIESGIKQSNPILNLYRVSLLMDQGLFFTFKLFLWQLIVLWIIFLIKKNVQINLITEIKTVELEKLSYQSVTKVINKRKSCECRISLLWLIGFCWFSGDIIMYFSGMA